MMTEEYKNLRNLIDSMDSQMGMLKDVIDAQKSLYGFTLFYDDVINLDDNVSEYTDDEIDTILNKICDKDKLISCQNDNPNWKDKSFYDYARYAIEDVQKSLNELNTLEKEKDKINKEIEDMTNNWFEYTNSDEYRIRREKRLTDFRNQIESEEDPSKKRKMEKSLKDIESAESLDFLFDRINKNGDNEVENIKNIYFDKHRSSLIMKKFKNKIIKHGCNEEIYKMFFNIEEKFLPEEYHDFNNIFLFHIMRFVSYTDSYNNVDKMRVSSILVKLYNLLYHKYSSTDLENNMIDIIKRFDGYFFKFVDEFKERNVTSPNHPVRIKRDNEYEQKVRMMIISSLQNEGIEPDTRLSTGELRNMLNDIIEKKSSENSNDETEIKNDNMEESAVTNDDLIVEDSPNVYIDSFNCAYIENVADRTYTYKDLSTNDIIENGIDETTILQLLSTDSIKRTTMEEISES